MEIKAFEEFQLWRKWRKAFEDQYGEYIPKRSAGQFWEDRDLIREQKGDIEVLKSAIQELKRELKEGKELASQLRISANLWQREDKKAQGQIQTLRESLRLARASEDILNQELKAVKDLWKYWESKAKLGDRSLLLNPSDLHLTFDPDVTYANGESFEVSGTGYQKSITLTEEHPTITITTSWDDEEDTI